MEALRLVIWRRDEIEPFLDEALFADSASATAYRALTSTPTVADAIAMAGADDPAAGDLLQRLAVEETEAEARDVLTRLVDEAAVPLWRRSRPKPGWPRTPSR